MIGRAKILIVDEQRAFAEALAVRLSVEPDLAVVAKAASLWEATVALTTHRPDVVILDVTIGEYGGMALARRIDETLPDVRVLVVTAAQDVETACAAVRAGVSGYVTKDSTTADLLRALRGALRDETWLPPELLTGVLRELRAAQPASNEYVELIGRLTPRERAVLEGTVAGLDREGIARKLVVSVNTVRTHTQNCYAKLGVHSSLEAVNVALRAGMRPPVLVGEGEA